MLTLETSIAFFSASCLLALAPGPDNIFVLTQSALHGKKAGLLVTLGLCTGLLIHTLAVALGVAAIFQTSQLAFALLKYLGAAYLLYLAWQAFTAPAEQLQTAGQASANNAGRLYSRGIIMNITNPKVSIFFLAFLPQFTDPTRGSITLQIADLGGLFICATILIFGGVALLAGSLRNYLRNSQYSQLLINKLAGSVFCGLALKLAFTER